MAADFDVSQHGGTAKAAYPTGADARTAFGAKAAVVAALVGGALLTALAATAYTAVGTIPGLPDLPPLVRFGLPATRALLDLAALATVGLSLLPKLLGFDRPKRTEPVLSPARRITVITALVWMLSALLSLVLHAAELSPGRSLTTGLLVDYVANVPAGPGLLASAGAGLLCAVLGLLAVRFGEKVPAELRTIVALLGLLPIPLTGHATDWRYHDFSMISMELHVIAAAMWTGGLAAVVLFVAPRRGLLAEALPRFSKLATIAIFAVGSSGLFNGLMELIITPTVGLPGLINTGYGQIILAKTGCLVALGAVASQLRFRLLPRIARHQRTALIGWAAAEVGVMGIAYGLGVVLSRAPVIV
ncbi:copper resistance D family protein [Saccharopolyspora phatthalungensis]|uniref:Putative copper resistance protein D n=1 Tax=Saccharopolyspora phatthalungensis TaxID=664693 RepID=A0A840Q182_9PSEU|nr:CopD family protein [Saccharopolyspora phatthalungensis]MBB5153757.1 putative copper resistance protein D [Saccharopolyspora phatthalungensis]